MNVLQIKLMPQLDITVFNTISALLLGLFLTYSAFLYVAVSYSFHKATSAYYFKFYILISALLILRSISETGENENKNFEFVNNKASVIKNSELEKL